MKKKLLYFFISLLILFSPLNLSIFSGEASAASCTLNTPQDAAGWSPASTKTRSLYLTLNVTPSGSFGNSVSGYISFKGGEFNPILDKNRKLAKLENFADGPGVLYIQKLYSYNGTYHYEEKSDHDWRQGSYKLKIVPPGGSKDEAPLCEVTFEIRPYCVIQISLDSDLTWPDTNIKYKVTEINPYIAGEKHRISLQGDEDIVLYSKDAHEFFNTEQSITNDINVGTYQVEVENDEAIFSDGNEPNCKSYDINISSTEGSIGCKDDSTCENDDTCQDTDGDGIKSCEPTAPYDAGQGLYACQPTEEGDETFYTCETALGTVKTNAEGFIKTTLALILGLAGGILLILIIVNGYKFMVSQGDPEKIKDAREGIMAAILGIFLIIFSITILTIITSDILGLPGFR